LHNTPILLGDFFCSTPRFFTWFPNTAVKDRNPEAPQPDHAGNAEISTNTGAATRFFL
jgi:hypothetical protein